MEYFTNEDYLQAKKQRRKTLVGYIVVLSIYLAISVCILIFYMNLPYGSSLNTWVRVAEYTLTFLTVVFTFVYMGIPYKRVNDYYKTCRNMKEGLKESSQGVLKERCDDVQRKNGVDMKAMTFSVYNQIKKVYFDRKVLVFYEKPFPEIDIDDTVQFVTQGNVLLSYEILKKAERKKTEEGENNESDSNGDR